MDGLILGHPPRRHPQACSNTLTRLGNFPSAFQFFPPGTYRLVVNTDMAANLTVTQPRALGMCKRRPHRPLFIVVCAPGPFVLLAPQLYHWASCWVP